MYSRVPNRSMSDDQSELAMSRPKLRGNIFGRDWVLRWEPDKEYVASTFPNGPSLQIQMPRICCGCLTEEPSQVHQVEAETSVFFC